jgi:hypothetical protein
MALLDERNNRPATTFWTGISESGALAVDTCTNFSAAASDRAGRGGDAVISDRFWDSEVYVQCNQSRSLMCVGTARNAEVTVEAPVGPVRRAFVTAVAVGANEGVRQFDQLCANEATVAQLPNASQFRALVAPTTMASPLSRFTNPNGARWVRTDGVALGDTAKAFVDGASEAPLAVDAKGAPTGELVVLTGAGETGVNALRKNGGLTCDNWSSALATKTGQRGLSTRVGGGMFFSEAVNCNSAFLHLYCLEN